MRVWSKALAVVATSGVLALTGRVSAQATPEPRRLQFDLRIPADPGGEAAFTSVSDIATNRNGDIFVLLPDDRSVQVFDRQGRKLRSIGRDGEGPGEFRWPMALGFRADTLWVWDPTLARLTLSRMDGVFIRSIPVGTIGSARLLIDGSIAVKRYNDNALTVGASGRLSAPILRYSDVGVILDTLADPAVHRSSYMVISTGRGTAQAAQPFSDGPLWGMIPDGSGVVVVDRRTATRPGAATYRVTRINVAGDTAFSREFPYTAAPVPPAVLEGVVSDWVERIARSAPAGGTSIRPDRDAIKRAINLPTTMAAVSAVAIGDDGTIWVRREEPAPTSQARWDVIRRDGQSVTVVAGPRALQIFRANAAAAWGIERDADGAVSVVRYLVR
ncbi:MAG: hypothetical protein KJZ74_06325 [Gemmatimonadales bacterium]|nr:hypothetical protein [Gemmatimonadota bacterium]MCL4213512.1 hypothetical protein [Gemmatimonadales bacterium]